MGGNPDADPAGTAKKLEDIKTAVPAPDADLIEAVAAAYNAIAAEPNVPLDQPAGQQMAAAVTNSTKALGAACAKATAPQPN